MVLHTGLFSKNVILTVVLIVLLNYFNSQYFFTSWRVDILLRSNVNDFFLLNFFFFWTNVWYLPKFLAAMLISFYLTLFYFFSVFHLLVLQSLLVVILLLFGSTTISYAGSYFTSFDNSKINLLLLNKVNRIHPPLFYLGFFVYFITPWSNYVKRFQQNYQRHKFVTYCSYSLWILSVSLYLGGWWALQEGSWGGWWNWDSSEVFGLCLFYTITRGYHLQLHLAHFSKLSFFSALCLYNLLLYYFLMQLSFTLISHNFGFRKKHFLFEKLLMGLALLHLLIPTYYVGKQQLVLRKRSGNKIAAASYYVLFFLIAVQVVFLIAVAPLMNYNFYMDAAASTSISVFTFLVILTLFLSFVFKYSSLLIVSTFLYCYSLSATLTMPLKVVLKNTWAYHHFIIIVLVFVIFFYANKSHSWFSLASHVSSRSSYLHPCHFSLFLSESPCVEIFKKLSPSRVFYSNIEGKVSRQSLLVSVNVWCPILNTLDYCLPYLVHIPAYLCYIFCFF